MRLYLLPGLGADTRLYNQLNISDQHEVIALPWIDAQGARNLPEYAALLHAYYALEAPYALGGVSLGGMLVQEWAKIAAPTALVLISTATSRSDMPGLIKLAAFLRMGPLLSKPLLTAMGVIGDRFTSKSEEGRRLFLDMLKRSDADFLAFGAAAILDWKATGIDVPSLRIHGSIDKVFPYGHWEGCKVIKGGNHFMIFDRAEEIGALVSTFLNATSSVSNGG
jgi:pimeloyl-ACP methyl ester carboxylesterase